MKKQQFPVGWDEARVRRLIDHYENMSDDEIIAEDEAAHQAGEDQLPVYADVAKTNGKVIVNGATRQKKRKQSKTPPRSKQRKGKRV